MSTEKMLAHAVIHHIAAVTPGGVTRSSLRGRKSAPIVVLIAWLPILVVLVLAIITR